MGARVRFKGKVEGEVDGQGKGEGEGKIDVESDGEGECCCDHTAFAVMKTLNGKSVPTP